jgi:hypothetical protein
MRNLALFGWFATVVCFGVVISAIFQLLDANEILSKQQEHSTLWYEHRGAALALWVFAMRKIYVCLPLGLIALGVAVYCTFIRIPIKIGGSLYDRYKRNREEPEFPEIGQLPKPDSATAKGETSHA